MVVLSGARRRICVENSTLDVFIDESRKHHVTANKEDFSEFQRQLSMKACDKLFGICRDDLFEHCINSFVVSLVLKMGLPNIDCFDSKHRMWKDMLTVWNRCYSKGWDLCCAIMGFKLNLGHRKTTERLGTSGLLKIYWELSVIITIVTAESYRVDACF